MRLNPFFGRLIERKSNQRLPRGRVLSAGKVQALMIVCCQDDSVKGCRDAALIAVLHGVGLRRVEDKQQKSLHLLSPSFAVLTLS